MHESIERDIAKKDKSDLKGIVFFNMKRIFLTSADDVEPSNDREGFSSILSKMKWLSESYEIIKKNNDLKESEYHNVKLGKDLILASVLIDESDVDESTSSANMLKKADIGSLVLRNSISKRSKPKKRICVRDFNSLMRESSVYNQMFNVGDCAYQFVSRMCEIQRSLPLMDKESDNINSIFEFMKEADVAGVFAWPVLQAVSDKASGKVFMFNGIEDACRAIINSALSYEIDMLMSIDNGYEHISSNEPTCDKVELLILLSSTFR